MSNFDFLNRFKYSASEIDIRRSRFKMPFSHKTTFTSGDLVPVGLVEVLPGDSFNVNVSEVCRMLTPVYPTMDNAFLDIFAFFVPNRIATAHPKDWEQICGENVNGYWAPSTEHTLISTGNAFKVVAPISPYSPGSYYGLPVGISTDNMRLHDINAMPFVGYRLIWNEWFRDQNTQAPVNTKITSDSEFSSIVCSSCLKVNKLHDYFTSCLPAPQKGASVLLPLGEFAPLVSVNDDPSYFTFGGDSSSGTLSNLRFNRSNINAEGTDEKLYTLEADQDGGLMNTDMQARLYSTSLAADLSNATAATINNLRQAFAIQRLLEKDARGGSRYRELLKTHYGAVIPDSTVQIPQYLGGKRVRLNITQVLQTSNTSSVSPLGQTGAFSNTVTNAFLFDKSFTEHGYIHILACVRTEQSYSQGIPRLFTRNRRYDWYYPAFANLGEQPVYTKELFVGADKDQVFGYQEAWADYRYLPNRVSGFLAPGADDNSLTSWTYTNNFDGAPILNSDFMKQSSSNIGDTLVFDGNYQFITDFYFDITAVRPMPLYSIPGLIDHH